MDMDGNEMFNNDDNKIPNYWSLFKNYSTGSLKDAAIEQMKKDPKGEQFKKYMMKNCTTLLNSYIHGLKSGMHMAIKMNFDEFSTYVFIIDIIKNVKQNEQSLKPEAIKPNKSELDEMYNKDKIQNEIDDIMNDFGV